MHNPMAEVYRRPRGGPLLDRCAASATGIMLHIHVSGYFRLTVPADEVIE
jgi:hypothetical protein